MKEDIPHEGGRPEKPLHDATVIVKPTLDNLGIERTQSHRWQRIADIPNDTFETFIEEQKEQGEVTTAGALRLASYVEHLTLGDV